MKTRAPSLRFVLLALALVALLAPATALAKKKHKRHGPKKENSPLVIGHRGASGFVPEHTLQSYRLAIKLGADYIEPDLVATKDGVLIARHEPIIGDSDPATTGDSTNVGDHPEFASRETTKTLDGVPTTGFWASDFTLAEIKTLGARQTRGGRPTEFNGQVQGPDAPGGHQPGEARVAEARAQDRHLSRDEAPDLPPGLSGCRSRAGW